jgi:hypothetical protein
VVRLEPEAVAVEKTDDRDRRVEQIGGQRRDVIECGFRRRVENLIAPHRRETIGCVGCECRCLGKNALRGFH